MAACYAPGARFHDPSSRSCAATSRGDVEDAHRAC
jgi:hypothetical protein